MRNIKISLEYDGTNYAGWQRQKNALTVEGKLEDALYKLIGKKIEVIGAGRTDAGVHSKMYVANFLIESNILPQEFCRAINSQLPEDIIILKSEEVELSYHARYMSKGKRYSYTLNNSKQCHAIGRQYAFYYPYNINLEAMRKATGFIIGTRDFAAFRNKGSSAITTIRTISEIKITSKNDIIVFEITANGFLYKMVRIIVGTLLKVGRGIIKPQDIEAIIASKDRTKAGESVPAKGLCLEELYY